MDFSNSPHSSHDNPLFSSSAVPAEYDGGHMAVGGEASLGSGAGFGIYQASSKLFKQPSQRYHTHTAEVDLMSLNPMPMSRPSVLQSMDNSDEL